MAQKTVMITGAGRGIGEACAKAFLTAGYYVIAAGRTAPAWEVPDDQEAHLERIALDGRDEEAVDAAFSKADSEGRTVRALVNNAGVSIGAPIGKMTTEIWRENFRVNTDGTFFCTRAAVRILLERELSGSVINIASVAGKNGFSDTSAYCAAKAAVIGFTRGLAAELGKNDITVNAICPGSVETPMIRGVIDELARAGREEKEAVRARMEGSIPMKRFQKPEDVAALALFLASDGARNISGESINLDGGAVRD